MGTAMPVLIVAHRSGPGAVKVANGSGGGTAPVGTTPVWTVACAVVTTSSFLAAASSGPNSQALSRPRRYCVGQQGSLGLSPGATIEML